MPAGEGAAALPAANLAGCRHFDHPRLPLPSRLGENDRLFRFKTPRRSSDAQPS
ncbi:hypothetical protein AvCA_05550 [Azotobacter vinelandii CA]|uniref:Uncharacterized protein n=2 Tax=Azotobacter vinelandii TaxID=354 RepID=C1DKE5_AZOVD|nr:hypothetical protein Avin_05550 [Azotobacter vinelandii DJ]AGK15577.1 hypothetical protein AvCA_05550 [Azotobacter vinelandii CA]AGK19385.1 hypothetical protein AvCA6_05550 [Azotobacter vinelandii CA6]